jgi:PAS domain S-box-containing protein
MKDASPHSSLRPPQELSPQRAVTLGIAWLAVVTAIEFLCPADVGFGVYAVFGIALIGWGSGTTSALAASAACLITLGWRDETILHRNIHHWPFVFNTFSRALLFASAGKVASALGAITRTHRKLAEKTTRMFEEEAERHRTTYNRLAETAGRFEQVIDNIAEVFWLTNVRKDQMVFISPGYERIWGRSCEALYQRPLEWVEAVHPDDRPEVLRRAETEQASSSYDIEYRIIRPDGEVRWIRDRAFPVRNDKGEVYRIAGIAEDVTASKRMSAALRQSERQILEITDREQARIGQDIHDGLCQELVSLAFDINDMEARLARQRHPDAAMAKRVATDLDAAITHARQVARGLFPIRMECDGLSSALEEFAASACERFKIVCEFQGCAVALPNDTIATHMYRIAQEAVNNSIKHSGASRIRIALKHDGDATILCIEDDGRGFSSDVSSDSGMGLHIMRYRAETIGAKLTVEASPAIGTVVRCKFSHA